jgi:hypothetical protein
MATLEERKRQRFLFMNRVYERTGGDVCMSVAMFELGNELGFTRLL